VLLGAAGTGLVFAGGWAALDRVKRREVEGRILPWITANAHGFDPARPDSLWTPALASALAGARIIGVGEATHGSHEDAAAKAAIIRGLVASGAVRSLFLEMNSLAGRELDAFIQGGTGDAGGRLRTSHAFRVFKTRALADLLGWLRDWNRTAAEPVRIFGIDCQSTAQDASDALAALRQRDPAAADRLAPRLDPIVSARARDLRFPALIKSLTTAQLQEAMTALEALQTALGTDPDDRTARYAARTAWQGLKAFELETADGKITGDADAYYARRDQFMAENILEAPADGPGVFWAHNGHVAAGGPPGSAFLPAGGQLRRRLGDAYRAVVFEYGAARFNAVPALPVIPPPSAAAPTAVIRWTGRDGRLAHLLDKARRGSFWIALRDLPDDEAGRAWRALPYKLAWPGYAATRWQVANLDPTLPSGSLFDVVVYITELTPSQPA
jgi:erythromycin esterase